MIGLSFLYPKFLTLLLLVPFFVFVYFFSLIYNKKKSMVFANFEAMERFYDIEFFSKNFMALYVNLVVLILLVLAASGTSLTMNVDTSAYAYVIAIDNSDSMSTTDILPSRFEVAKKEAKDFVDLLPLGVEVGVIGFSGDASTLHTLDTSKLKIKMAIDNVDYGRIPGTNIYNALVSANKLFEDRQNKVVILISDGQLNVGDAPQINRFVNRNNIIVYTIAVGTSDGGLTNREVISRVDLDFLKSLAFNSDGEFFMVDDESSFEASFSGLIQETNREVKIDLSFYLLLLAIVVFTLNWIFYNLRFKVYP